MRWPLQGRAAARSSNDVRSYGARDGVPLSDVRTSGELSPPGASRVSAQRFESGASVPAWPLPPGPALRTTVVRRGLPTHTCNVIRVRGDDLRSEPHAATAQGPTASHAARRRRNAPPPRTYRAAGASGKPRRHIVLFYAAINAMQLSVCGLSAVICIVVSTIELVACDNAPWDMLILYFTYAPIVTHTLHRLTECTLDWPVTRRCLHVELGVRGLWPVRSVLRQLAVRPHTRTIRCRGREPEPC